MRQPGEGLPCPWCGAQHIADTWAEVEAATSKCREAFERATGGPAILRPTQAGGP